MYIARDKYFDRARERERKRERERERERELKGRMKPGSAVI